MGDERLKGSMTVEASIIIPLVVICILPFIYLFRMLLFQLILEKGLDECVKEMAAEIYVLERISVMPEYSDEEEKAEVKRNELEQMQALIDEYTALLEEEGWKEKTEELGFELLGELLLEQKLKNWLKSENLNAWGVENGWGSVSVGKSDFFYSQEGHHYLIKGAVSFNWKKLFSFWNTDTVTLQRVYHSFVGEEANQKGGGEETEDESFEMVYRIGDGTRYHKASCYLICKNVYTITKSDAEKTGCSPCDRCKPQNEVTVYKTSGGDHYHTDSCSYLYPEVTSLTLEEAISLGYRGCGICQGENNYFS